MIPRKEDGCCCRMALGSDGSKSSFSGVVHRLPTAYSVSTCTHGRAEDVQVPCQMQYSQRLRRHTDKFLWVDGERWTSVGLRLTSHKHHKHLVHVRRRSLCKVQTAIAHLTNQSKSHSSTRALNTIDPRFDRSIRSYCSVRAPTVGGWI